MLASLFTAFVAMASILSASAAPGLSLKVTGPTSVNTVEAITVTIIITNTGDETLKILNDPLSPFSKLPTDTFVITNGNGSVPAFTGIRAKYVPEAAKSGGYTVLVPKQSIKVDHNLGEAYSFTNSGEGTYTIEPRNTFYIVSPSNEISIIQASVEQAHGIKISGKLAVARSFLDKRATYIGCTPARQAALASAASAAQSYAAETYAYVQSQTEATPRYSTWFGTYESSRHEIVVDHFSKISANGFSSYTYDCNCIDPFVYAYVYPDQFGHVYLCGAFWNAPATGADSKADTLIHEASHFSNNGGTIDTVYGQPLCKLLARNDPSSAIRNADSHGYFAANSPSLA